MQKPAGYDNATVGNNDFTPINLGGHKLVIIGTKEVQDKGYVTIQYDTAKDDAQPSYYQTAYKSDTRPDKKYGGNHNVFTETRVFDGRQTNAFKNFLSAVESSNAGYKFDWNNPANLDTLKGKYVGGVFVEEEYVNNSGEIKIARKLRYWRSVEGALTAEIPKKKEIDKSNNNAGFMVIPDNVDDAGLPFN